MDEELLKLESELSALRPAQPSADLQLRLAQIRPVARTTARALRWSWLALPAAAALTLAYFNATPTAPSNAAPVVTASPTFKPVSAKNVLLDSRDDGYATLTDGTPVHRTREIYLDTITWKNPQTKASLTWSVPREEIRIIPVAFQ
ncbi:MAG: hypothetical protein ABIZ04_20630 [Opitutus sp.]